MALRPFIGWTMGRKRFRNCIRYLHIFSFFFNSLAIYIDFFIICLHVQPTINRDIRNFLSRYPAEFLPKTASVLYPHYVNCQFQIVCTVSIELLFPPYRVHMYILLKKAHVWDILIRSFLLIGKIGLCLSFCRWHRFKSYSVSVARERGYRVLMDGFIAFQNKMISSFSRETNS